MIKDYPIMQEEPLEDARTNFLRNILIPRLRDIEQRFNSKAREYATLDDLYHNFIQGGIMDDISPLRCLWDYMRKHLVSIQDIVNNPCRFNEEIVVEKTSDIITYLILLEGIYKHFYTTQESTNNQSDKP